MGRQGRQSQVRAASLQFIFEFIFYNKCEKLKYLERVKMSENLVIDMSFIFLSTEQFGDIDVSDQLKMLMTELIH